MVIEFGAPLLSVVLLIAKPVAKSQSKVKAQVRSKKGKKEFGLWAFTTLNIMGHPPHPSPVDYESGSRLDSIRF